MTPPPFASSLKQPQFRKSRSAWHKLSRLLLLVTGVAVAAWGIWQLLPSRPIGSVDSLLPGLSAALPSFQEEAIILVMGVDANEASRRHSKAEDLFEGARTDTMALLRVKPSSKEMALISLPRDSKVYLNQQGKVGKLNSAFATGGAEHARQIVEQAFGIPVHHYIVVNLSSVKEFVDMLGGVEVTVPKRMRYRDSTAGLVINLQPGKQRLNGEQAEAFVRFRHDSMGDIGRIRRQQQFMAAVRKQIASGDGLKKLGQILQKKDTLLQTDLSVQQLLSLANFTRAVPTEQLRVATLPGHGSTREVASYWIIDPVPATELLNRLLFDQYPEGITPVTNETPVKIALLLDSELAGTEQAESYLEALSAGGYEVLCKETGSFGNSQFWESSYRATPETTRAIRKLLPPVSKAPTVFKPFGTTYEMSGCSSKADYTILLGSDS